MATWNNSSGFFMRVFFRILFLTIFLYSCQGKSKKVANTNLEKKIPIEKKINNSNKESHLSKNKAKEIYFPEKFETSEMDTILQDGIKIKITQKSIMNSSVVKKYDENGTFVYHKYRDSEVILEILGLSKKLITKRFIKETFFVDVKEFYSIATITNLWFDSFDADSKTIKLHCTMCEPETDYCYFYSIYVNENGKIKIELEEVT